MDSLARHWAQPLAAAGALELQTRVSRIEPDALDQQRWQLHTSGPQDSVHVFSGFDAVLLAVPHALAAGLLRQSGVAPALAQRMAPVTVAPCWTLMLAFPQAVQPTLAHLGPQWNAAHSTHHRIAWLARESSKPGRSAVERWTVQASPAWSQEHLEDDDARIQAKLLKAFAEVTGIYAEPAYAQVHRWRWARTENPLGTSHLWDAPRPGRRVRRLVPGPSRRKRLRLGPGTRAGGSSRLSSHDGGERRGNAFGRAGRPNDHALRRPLRALAHRSFACRIAGGGPGQLAGRPGPARPLAGAHRGRRQASLRRRGGPMDPAPARRLRPDARRAAAVAVAARPALPGRARPPGRAGAGLPLRLFAQGHRAGAGGARAGPAAGTANWSTPAPAAPA